MHYRMHTIHVSLFHVHVVCGYIVSRLSMLHHHHHHQSGVRLRESERIVHNGSDVWTYMYIPSKRLFLALYYFTYLTLSLCNRASRVCQPYIFLEKASRQE